MKQAEKNLKDAFDLNTQTITDLRTQLENEKERRLRNMEIACKSTNSQQLDEKMNRDRLTRNMDTKDKLNHINYVTNNDFYTENTVQ